MPRISDDSALRRLNTIEVKSSEEYQWENVSFDKFDLFRVVFPLHDIDTHCHLA